MINIIYKDFAKINFVSTYGNHKIGQKLIFFVIVRQYPYNTIASVKISYFGIKFGNFIANVPFYYIKTIWEQLT